LAPRLHAGILKRKAKNRTVQEALNNHAWVLDFAGALSVGVMVEYLQLWDLLQEVVLQPEVEDTYFWRLSPTGQYSAKLAYEGLFLGATNFSPWDRIWKTWAPPKCRFFMWLVAHKRCRTADRLARRGLPHPEHCPLCDQADESIDHLLVTYVFTRQFWFYIFQQA
jgi:hypothetical protein